VLAAFISYLIYPLLEKMMAYRIPPFWSIVILFLLFIGIFLFLCYKSFPSFIDELEELSKQLPYLLEQYESMIYQVYESTSFLPEAVHDKIESFIAQLESLISGKINQLLTKILQITDFIVFLAIIPVLVFYFLKDFKQIKQWLIGLTPTKYHVPLEKMLKAIDESLGGYVRGQLTISTVIIAVTYLVYDILELKYALILAIVMGIMNIIPYFGPIIGTIPAALIALTTSIKLFLIIIITNMMIQLLESSFLSPYIMGKHVQIHPIVLIFTLLVGAELGGIIGMIVAVPLVTILRAIYRQMRKETLQSN